MELLAIIEADAKALVEAAGVIDGDPVYALDIGLYAQAVNVDRTIEDDCAGVLDR